MAKTKEKIPTNNKMADPIKNITLENRNNPLILLSPTGDDFIAHAVHQMAVVGSDNQVLVLDWFQSETVRLDVAERIPYGVNYDEVLTKQGKDTATQIANLMLESCLANKEWDGIQEQIDNLFAQLALETIDKVAVDEED